MVTKVNTEEAPPTHAKFPLVSNLHNTVPVTPTGWVKVWLKMYSGARNVAIMISATARFTSKKFIGIL